MTDEVSGPRVIDTGLADAAGPFAGNPYRDSGAFPASLPGPGLWPMLVEKLGFPIIAFGVVVALGVGYHRHTREDAAAVRVHFSEQLDKLNKAQREDRDAITKALERVNTTLERLDTSLKERHRK